ncbi:gamma-aminobutyric acid type B receptor subunit 2-like isoform X3 [Gouania willdenowi]|uniref:gamma-aminobutyric acid type B receptor subunit 2-like isoform X3 n=1 Tax=Gouania willdenowi TaxID=441366 RepID=UPI00105669BB|nr:gamma-aminobutyric acid type B receptor subunit 2-like isoform X3 [Gouania willdenowi]
MMELQVLLVLLLVGSGWPSFLPPILWVEPEGSGSSLSLKELRDQLELLRKFDLQLHRLQLPCNVSSALRSLFDSLWAEPNYLLLLGGACPQVNAVIGRALAALDLVQVSYEAPPPSGKKWEGLFSMAPSNKNQNRAIVRLLQEYHWTRVGVLAQDRRRQTQQMKEDLVRQMLKVGLQVDHLRVSEDICSSLRTLKLWTEDTDVRTIVALLEDQDAEVFFCCAYRLHLVSPQYQWLLIGPTDRRASIICSKDHVRIASDRSVIVRTRDTGQDLLHDSLLVGGGALSHVTKELRIERWGDPTNQRRDTRRLLMEALRRTHFIGLTGLVSFYQGERTSCIDVIQFQGNSSVLVGNFSTRTQQLHLNSKLHFNAPTDSTSSFLLLFILSSSAAIIIIIIILKILATSGRHWDLDLPLLLCSSSVLLSGLEETFYLKYDFLYSARLWTLSLGHTGVLTVLIHRSWKIYSLHNTDGKTPPPGTLMLGPALLDLLLLTLKWAELQGHTERQAQMLIGPFYERWIAATCSFKAPLMVLGCLLAWTIRHEPGGPRLTFCLFSVMVFSQSWLIVHLLTSHNKPVHSCLSALLVMGCVILMLLSTSTPEVRELWEEDGEDEDEELQCVVNLQLRTVSAELDCEIESISLQLSLTEQTNGVYSVFSSSSGADIQVFSHSPDPNSPEHVRRRLSLQLPILHHSYLPVIGGLSCSSSNQTLDGKSHDSCLSLPSK